MKALSVGYLAHLAQQYHTIATCWRVELTNGQIKGFTDHDKDLVIGEGSPTVSVTYLAASGYTASAVRTSDALNVDQLEVQGMLSSPSIIDADLRAGIWDYAHYEIFEVNWDNLTLGRDIKRVGRLGEVSTNRATFNAEFHGLMQAFERVIGELTGPSCRASLGDERCQVDLYPFTVTGVVTYAHPDNVTFTDSSRAEAGPTGAVAITEVDNSDPCEIETYEEMDLRVGQAIVISAVVGPEKVNGVTLVTGIVSPIRFQIGIDATDTAAYPPHTPGTGFVGTLGSDSGYFDFGILEWLTGLNTGLRMEVKQYTTGQISLALPMPYTIQVGDTYTMHAGCDKQLATCRDRFNNVVNRRAEDYVAGIDKLVQVGRRG